MKVDLWESPISKEKEDKQKRRMRREFLDIARHQIKDSFEEQKAFVWNHE